jgi:hypothetical protein
VICLPTFTSLRRISRGSGFDRPRTSVGARARVAAMKFLFVTQNRSLNVFHALHKALLTRCPTGRCGYVIADSWYYENWRRAHPEFESAGYRILKEWEVTAARAKPDLALIRRYEERLGEPNLMRALLADRRLSMGPNCAYSQDYRRRFSDDQLLAILQEGLVSMDRLFDELAPDVVLGFICVTFLDYLAYLFARAHRARYLNLRFARIADRMVYASTLTDPAPEFEARYAEVLRNGSASLAEARTYVEKVRASNQLYEGVFKASHPPGRRLAGLARPFRAASKQLADYYRYRRSPAVSDNHVPDPLLQLLYGGAINPLRAWRQSRTFLRIYVQLEDLRTVRYAFFPLHTEPEISLLVYGRPYVNQLEVARAFAESLPADMFLVVKEHPWMVGKRRTAYYRKLLAIPKVKLAHPGIRGSDLIRGAAVLVTVSGSAALEAAVYKKAVVTLGQVPFTVLPSTMVAHGSDLARLPETMAALLKKHTHDESALEAFLATLYEQSRSIHWYSTLLGRAEYSNTRESSFVGEVESLADFTLARLGDESHAVSDKLAALEVTG